MEASGTTRRFTADEVRRMVEAGILHHDERLELLDGELFVVSPPEPSQRASTLRLSELLAHAYGPRFAVRAGGSVEAGPTSLPEPDVAVVRGRLDEYRGRRPGPADVPLLVEVADASNGIDRRKARIYAAAGYSAFWLVDLAQRRVEVHERPRPEGRYEHVTALGEHFAVRVPGGDLTVDVGSLF